MSVLEKTIEAAVKRYAEKHGCLTYKMNGFGHRGWPDRMFLYRGNVLFMEFKRKGGKLTILQDHIHNQLRNQRFEVFVVDDVSFGKKIIDEFRDWRAS